MLHNNKIFISPKSIKSTYENRYTVTEMEDIHFYTLFKRNIKGYHEFKSFFYNLFHYAMNEF